MAYFDTRTFGSGVPIIRFVGTRILTCPFCGGEVKVTSYGIGVFLENLKCPYCGKVMAKVPWAATWVPAEKVSPLIPPETEIPTPTTTPPGEEVPVPPLEEVPPVSMEKVDWTKYLPWIILGIGLIFMGKE